MNGVIYYNSGSCPSIIISRFIVYHQLILFLLLSSSGQYIGWIDCSRGPQPVMVLERVLGSQAETETRVLSGAFTATIPSWSLAGNPSLAPSPLQAEATWDHIWCWNPEIQKVKVNPGLAQLWLEAPRDFRSCLLSLHLLLYFLFKTLKGIISVCSQQYGCPQHWGCGGASQAMQIQIMLEWADAALYRHGLTAWLQLCGATAPLPLSRSRSLPLSAPYGTLHHASFPTSLAQQGLFLLISLPFWGMATRHHS